MSSFHMMGELRWSCTEENVAVGLALFAYARTLDSVTPECDSLLLAAFTSRNSCYGTFHRLELACNQLLFENARCASASLPF